MLTVTGSGDSFAVVAPFGDGYFRVMGWNRKRQVPDTAPVDLEEIRAIAREALGADYGLHDPAGSPASTATNARRRPIASAASSSPGTPRTSTPPPAARA